MYAEQHRFAMQLAQLSRGWRAELDRRLADLGLSQARWLVLLHLARFDHEPTQRELAQSVAVEGPTLARLLDSLEAQGLVHRKASAEDRRAKRISRGSGAAADRENRGDFDAGPPGGLCRDRRRGPAQVPAGARAHLANLDKR